MRIMTGTKQRPRSLAVSSTCGLALSMRTQVVLDRFGCEQQQKSKRHLDDSKRNCGNARYIDHWWLSLPTKRHTSSDTSPDPVSNARNAQETVTGQWIPEEHDRHHSEPNESEKVLSTSRGFSLDTE